jgi:hypothetical protein
MGAGGPSMKNIRISICAGVACVLITIAMGGRAAAVDSVRERPSQWAACRAWDMHIADLLAQHRLVDDLSQTEFSEVSSRFHAAKSACWVGSFDEGLAIYGSMPIGRPKRLVPAVDLR